MNLIRFTPFREWSPIWESLEEQYPNADVGVNVMEELAMTAGDKSYLRFLKLYRYFPFRCMTYLLRRQLLSPKRKKLYNLIYQKIESASEQYPERDYGPTLNAEIEQIRQHVSQILFNEGYTGKYPFYRKGNIQIIAAEEHPFTIMEQEAFQFRVQLMVSECRQPEHKRPKHRLLKDEKSSKNENASYIYGSKEERNAGFFKGKGHRGWIESLEDFTKRFNENSQRRET